jgi:hypothetical protein
VRTVRFDRARMTGPVQTYCALSAMATGVVRIVARRHRHRGPNLGCHRLGSRAAEEQQIAGDPSLSLLADLLKDAANAVCGCE